MSSSFAQTERRFAFGENWRDFVDGVDDTRLARAREFALEKLKTCGGSQGCNEFTFEKAALP